MRRNINMFSTRRLEALTDGVFAIAMTLLVLDLSTDTFGNIQNSADLYHALQGMSTNIMSFIVAFLLLGSMWSIHTRQFEYITRTDRHMNFLNTVRLLLVVLIPFTTSISASYSGVVLGRVLLPINFLLLALASFYQWGYAIDPKNKLYDDIPKEIRTNIIAKLTVFQALFVVIASIWIGNIAFLVFLFTPFFSSRMDK